MTDHDDNCYSVHKFFHEGTLTLKTVSFITRSVSDRSYRYCCEYNDRFPSHFSVNWLNLLCQSFILTAMLHVLNYTLKWLDSWPGMDKPLRVITELTWVQFFSNDQSNAKDFLQNSQSYYSYRLDTQTEGQADVTTKYLY